MQYIIVSKSTESKTNMKNSDETQKSKKINDKEKLEILLRERSIVRWFKFFE